MDGIAMWLRERGSGGLCGGGRSRRPVAEAACCVCRCCRRFLSPPRAALPVAPSRVDFKAVACTMLTVCSLRSKMFQSLWMWRQEYQHHEQLPLAFNGTWPSWNSDLDNRPW